ncbi:exported protein family 3 Plasmodium exported, putative [Plasmodium reichenowi]|uniref:Exported protein family 3 Plasmodium exported, putative n=1 Tax=Plasmodium reichenowi TaxID=5854 RepID=A0A2P9DT86_PLARE|nr:exported protein family 3 Plasmodium exported, putative [Plasmodium reichenowi]
MNYFLSLFNVSLFFLLIFKYSYKNIVKKGLQDKINKSIITINIASRTLTENNKKCYKKYIYTSIFNGNKNPQKREKKNEEEKQKDSTKVDNDNNVENEMEDYIDDSIDDPMDDLMNDKWEHHNSLEDSIKEYYISTDPSDDEENNSFFKKLKLIMKILDEAHSDLLINNSVTNGSIFSPELVPISVLSTMTLACPPIGTMTLPYIIGRINFLNRYEEQNINTEHDLNIFK